MKKKEPRYTMRQIRKAWNKHVGNSGIMPARWEVSTIAKRLATELILESHADSASLKRQAAAEKRKAKPKRGLSRTGANKGDGHGRS